jgi:hypothetical protein
MRTSINPCDIVSHNYESSGPSVSQQVYVVANLSQFGQNWLVVFVSLMYTFDGGEEAMLTQTQNET